jgi:PAS domain S-box-containing protein
MPTPDGAEPRPCAADSHAQSGWNHFALAERAAKFGYWRTNLADGTMFWSPGMYRLLGVDPGLRPPDSTWLLDQILPEDVTHLLAEIDRAVETKSPFSYRTRAKDPTAEAQIVDTHGQVELDDDGNVIAVVGVCNDVTAQVTAEDEREKAQRIYRVMAEEASDIIVLHEDGEIVFTTSALHRILKRRPDEFQNGRYMDLVHPDDVEEARKVLGTPSPGETRTATYRVRHADGHYVWFEISTRGIYESGAFRHEISVGRDITERKEHELRMMAAQQRAEAANKAKSLFLANMSHELRTPLNAIIGFADVMRGEMFGPLGGERYGEYAGLIHDSGRLLLDLISDILDMAKIEAGKLELNFEAVNLADTIEDCLRLVRAKADAAGVSLEVSGPVTRLAADARAMKQILLNLLTNAVKFTQAGGQVFVETGSENGRAFVTVRDTGIGIPAEHLPRLGMPFEQASSDASLAKPGAGTGLGLALVRALAEAHGGAMQIESEVGCGTTVTVRLPFSPAQSVVAADAA